MNTCYECEKPTSTLIWKSRCKKCTIRRLEFNMRDNTHLRNELAKLKKQLKSC